MGRKVFVTSEMSIDERLIEVAEKDSVSALLWPWLLTIFDDWGRAEANTKRLKAQVFPSNDIVTSEAIEKALELYQESDLITLYEVDGKQYMSIDKDKWFNYQTHIRREKREKDDSRYPAPPEEDVRAVARDCAKVSADDAELQPSPSPSPSLTPTKDNTPIVPSSGDESEEDKPKTKPVPYKEIVDIYNKTCTSLPKVRSITKARKRTMKARYDPKTGIDKFKELFEIAEATPFLKGQNKNGWTATFDWLMNENNMAKVLEKQYMRGGLDNERCRGDTQAEVGPPKRSKFARYYENNGTN